MEIHIVIPTLILLIALTVAAITILSEMAQNTLEIKQSDGKPLSKPKKKQ